MRPRPRALLASSTLAALCLLCPAASRAAGKMGGDGGAATPAAPAAPGFRLEGQPQLEIPFGDADAYRRTVDRFHALHDQMRELRDDFSRSVQDVLGRVAAGDKKPKKCPEAEITAPFARAFALGQQYLRSGRELERAFSQVKDLDELGETQGLTPDYRFKAKRVLELYRQLLGDYREMKIAFHEQLSAEIRFAGCDPAKLVAHAEQVGKDALVAETTETSAAGPASKQGAFEELRTAATVTFFVDNVQCKEPVRVYLDQVPLGRVDNGSKGGFRAKAGPHDLCLLGSADKKTCGMPGTVRRAYLHEGYAITRRCAAK